MAEIKIEGSQIIQLNEKEQLDGSESFILQDSEGNKMVTSSNLGKYVSDSILSELGEIGEVKI